LSLELDKTREYYKNSKTDLEDATEKLHQTNRVRHELEYRLHAELEASYRQKITLDEKVRLIEQQEIKLDYFELQRKTDLDRHI
jgi:hypothetical protein